MTTDDCFHKQKKTVLLYTLSLKVCSICKITYIYILSILSKYIIQFISNLHIYSALECHTHYFLAFLHFQTHHLEGYLVWCTHHCHNFELSSSGRDPHNSHLYKNKYLYYINRERKRVVIDSRASINIF